MTTLLTPGVYRQSVGPVQPLPGLVRGDIPVFLGYTRRGPPGLAVRVESVIDFTTLFGEPLNGGHLAAAIKGFFESGGRRAYVIRIAQETALTASAILVENGARLKELDALPKAENPLFLKSGNARPLVWQAQAGFWWRQLDPRGRDGKAKSGDAAWVQQLERIQREQGWRTDDPGSWANQVSVRIRRTARSQTYAPQAIDTAGEVLLVDSLAGLEAHSIVEISQPDSGSTTRVSQARVKHIDPIGGQLTLATPLTNLLAEDGSLAGFDPTAPTRLESVEFDIQIYVAGKLTEQFAALAPHPDHASSLHAQSSWTSSLIGLAPLWLDPVSGAPLPAALVGPMDWANPDTWPIEGDFNLAGGTDGLDDVGAQDYDRVLKSGEVSRLDEVALIAAPDLVLPSMAPPPYEPPIADTRACDDLTVPARGEVFGRVVDIGPEGEERPLAGVEVDIAGPGGQTTTDTNGEFTLTDLPLSLASLRLTRAGYERLEYFVQPDSFSPSAPEIIILTPVTLPRPLEPAEILEVQRQLGNASLVGPYKVAILDPPSAKDGPEVLRAWRARLGDQMRAAFYGPWLRVPTPDGSQREIPPSGHVCGAFAAAERAVGIHRSAANLPLRFCDGLTVDIAPEVQAILNPEGINLIRAFPGRGVRVFGARTLSSDPDWRYVSTRRVIDAIERSLEKGLQWMVFEPNTVMSRHGVEVAASSLLNKLWRAGALAGETPQAAYSVKCDLDNNPDNQRAQGKLLAEIAVAPTTPFEFIVFRIGNVFDALKVTEAN